MRFLISAGEASGELYGAGLIEALRRRAPDAGFFGVGGQRMRDAGFDTVIDAHEISVLGLAEVVTHLPKIYGKFKRLVREARNRKPDAAILIDFPDFNLRLARQLHQLGIPVIYYVSPQLWAWRQGRVDQIKKYVRKMLVIFPFETEFYRRHGVEALYVGHPLVDEPMPTVSREQYAALNHLDPEKTWISLLPGSRRKEFTLNFGSMLDAAIQLGGRDRQFILPVASSLTSEWVQRKISGHAGGRDLAIRLVEAARPALLHSRAAIVASGTATLETALIGTPFVMVYRVSPLSWMLGRKLVKVDRFAMPNLIAGRDVVPEFVQDKFQPTAISDKVRQLLDDGPARRTMLNDLAEVKAKLHSVDSTSTSERAAAAVLETICR
ncbi:MAG TPA: lipid-A-disaccharide synthase [Terriglobales bacterium]|nr:lipid-A-disaccharide synthase [Terriglobales bacterium]